ncbi:Copine-8 [Lamellibrachia satsuma]|nr:Copine-8 [Lamellibrachia satsuma]
MGARLFLAKNSSSLADKELSDGSLLKEIDDLSISASICSRVSFELANQKTDYGFMRGDSARSVNLADMDVFSKSDPMCVLYTIPYGTDMWTQLDCTEIIWNNLNPDFVKKFVLEYYFEEQQKLKFCLYDVDSKSADLSKHDFLGSAEFTLAEIVSSYGRVTRSLQGCKISNNATILVSAEELSLCKEEVTLQFCGRNLDKKDFFGKSDPFLLFYRFNEDMTSTVVHKTEVIKVTLNPTWKPFTIPVRALCNGDYDRSLKVECYDWDKDGGHDLIGVFSTTLKELQAGPGPGNVYQCINEKKKKKKGKKYINSGTIELLYFKVDMVHSFLDYIRGGTQVHCTIAVDFTASNGNPNTPQSLHYITNTQPNMYEQALRAVGEIIQEYDSDKLFPALGFGAKLPPDGRVSHEFFLNGHQTNPYCSGINGVIDAYHHTLHTVQLYGPTNFAPVINHVAGIAQNVQDGKNYFILLILTDGIITDMPQTTEAIVNASTLPLSIIIVGIGQADFEAMNILDGDDVRLSSRGKFAERDIVQFVPFRDFMKEGNFCQSQASLAKEVLAEIPDQFLSYMKKHNFKPGSPPTAPPGYEELH